MADMKHVQDVVIVGGSVSGLCCGIILKRCSKNVTILEQSLTDDRESQAAGIGMTEQIIKLFETAEIPLEDVGPKAENVLFYDSVNCELGKPRTIPYNGIMTAWNVLYYRLRAHFDGFTSEICPQKAPPASSDHDVNGVVSYETGKQVSSIDYLHSEGIVLVHYEDLKTNTTGTVKTKLLIGADGGNSIIRSLLLKRTLPRPYSGYLAWRGTFPYSQFSADGQKFMRPGIAPFCGNKPNHTHVVTYIIPNEKGAFEPSESLVNFVWYDRCPLSSPTFKHAMTDVDGKFHRHTVPPGKLNPDAWEAQRQKASDVLPPPFNEMADKISHRPFITAVSDVLSPDCVFLDGHAVLVGEALGVARPHGGRATNEAARQALLLKEVVLGKITWRSYRTEVMGMARINFYHSRAFGLVYLGGKFSSWWANLAHKWAQWRYKISKWFT